MTFRLRDTLTTIGLAALILAWEALVLWLAIRWPLYFYGACAVAVVPLYYFVKRWLRGLD